MSRRLLRVVVSDLAPGMKVLSSDASRYVVNVHRLSSGDSFLAIDPDQGVEARATVERVDRGQVFCRIEDPEVRDSDGLRVTLLCSMSKGDKVERVLRGATELGVSRIGLVISERSVVRPPRERVELRRQRWLTVLREAARQSGRSRLPELLGSTTLEEALASEPVPEPFERRWVLHPESEQRLGDCLALESAHVQVLVGPEGGFSDAEIQTCELAGYVPVRFGTLVLRSETAALAVLGAIVASATARR